MCINFVNLFLNACLEKKKIKWYSKTGSAYIKIMQMFQVIHSLLHLAMSTTAAIKHIKMILTKLIQNEQIWNRRNSTGQQPTETLNKYGYQWGRGYKTTYSNLPKNQVNMTKKGNVWYKSLWQQTTKFSNKTYYKWRH